jgi:hypothetical protein
MLTANTLEERVSYYMQKLNFPTDANDDLLAALGKICHNGATFSALSDILAQYAADARCHFTPILEQMRALCDTLGIHTYTGELLLYLCMADALRAHYRAKGISEEIFWNTLADLAYKLEECRLIYGINGSFVGEWFKGFFKLERFALGRLQFELMSLKKPGAYRGKVFPEGTTVINVHIPRTGTRLDHAEVEKAYKMARKFFADAFPAGPAIFNCSSWLLYPWNLEVLSPSSNLRAFIGDYEIVRSGDYEDYSSLWRLFDCNYTGNPDDLPQDSSLRRAYAARVKRGEPTGYGVGFFLMD